ncbi:hypothetical protein RRG08_053699 [Elysia crispata]|uniref:Chitin-binding type-2 domain-containing protein n=1 Tax=Elysia crispata TaxID=231223 RepID=A0AAE0ZRB6_9GAST|nr:hypothetical protein RRG08_053699 [Elysia crispata]
MWNPWSHWSACEDRFGRLDNDTKQPCGDQSGQMKRSRSCRRGSCQRNCVGDNEQSIACQMKPCCEDPVWSTWSDWGECSDAGLQKRKRMCASDRTKWRSPTCQSRRCQGPRTGTQRCDVCPACVKREWSSWFEWSPCGSDHGQSRRYKVRYRSCIADQRSSGPWCSDPCEGSNMDTEECCTSSSWGEWSAWGRCSSDTGQYDLDTGRPCGNGAGIKNRNRTCQYGTCGDACAGDRTSRTSCYMEPCCAPARWGPWTEWSTCNNNEGLLDRDTGKPCGEGKGCQTRNRTCILGNCDKKYMLCGWTSWEECTGNPLKSTRRRHCHPIPPTREILRYCRGGPECDTTNLLEERRCYCGSVEWQPWQRWTECDLPQTRFRTRTRTCRVVGNSTPECPRVAPTCSGLGRESKRCPCDPPQWGSWYPWQPCELHTNGLMIRSRIRPCISLTGTCRNVTCVGSSVQLETCQCSKCLRILIVTCRNVTCVGSSVQVETCQCSEWSRGLIVTCRNVTCVGSSVQVGTCQCSEWSRGLIVTCRNVTCVGSSVQVETCQCSEWSRGLIVTCRNVTCVGSSVQLETCQCSKCLRILIVTCRNVTCVGSSVQVETCQCSEWLRGLIVTCRNVTCVGSNVQVGTCQCSEWSRGLIVTCRNVTCVGSSVQVETCQCSKWVRGLIVTFRNVTCVGSSVQVETCQCSECLRILIVTCRNVTCVGSSVQEETCQCSEWSRGLIVTCRNVTCVSSSVQEGTCQCREWSRGLIVTCRNVTCVGSSVQVETCQCSKWLRGLIVTCRNVTCVGSSVQVGTCQCKKSTLSAWTSWSECRRNTRGEQTRTRTRRCIPALSNPAYCEDAPATWRMCIGQGRTKQEVFCSTPPRIIAENECTGRTDGEYASSKRRGCTAYIFCCNGKATEHYCEHPKFFDSVCQECISRSQTCSPSAKDGFDIHKDAMDAAKLQAEKHRFCTTRRRRRSSKVCP